MSSNPSSIPLALGAALSDGVAADIWYDAKDHGDASAADTIELTQGAMEEASALLPILGLIAAHALTIRRAGDGWNGADVGALKALCADLLPLEMTAAAAARMTALDGLAPGASDEEAARLWLERYSYADAKACVRSGKPF